MSSAFCGSPMGVVRVAYANSKQSGTDSYPESRHIAVIGAGVVGLTTAVKIQEQPGYHVTIIAETSPTEAKNIRYTSPWAGAHHVSSAGEDPFLSKLDLETLNVMWDLSSPESKAEECFLRLDQSEFYRVDRKTFGVLNKMPGAKSIAKDKLVPGAASGVSFRTVTIDTPKYLNYLLSRFLEAGGITVKGTVQHISQVVEGGFTDLNIKRKVDAVVVCAGLGARMLGGVEDQAMYPVRGQTVLLDTPWVKFGRTMTEEDGLKTYTIPRRSGQVIVGGTMDRNDWYPTPRPEITKDILQRVLRLCPELAPPEIRASREPTFEDLIPLIIEEGCGLRPARHGGLRIGVQILKDNKGEREVPVVHNYGHGGFGYQSSWGSASLALDLLGKALTEQCRSRTNL